MKIYVLNSIIWLNGSSLLFRIFYCALVLDLVFYFDPKALLLNGVTEFLGH